MPAFPFVSIGLDDDSVDFGKFRPVPTTKSNGLATAPQTTPIITTRNLILAPPSIAAHEEKLHALFATYDRATSDLQMLDRLVAGFVPLSHDAYDIVLVLTGDDGAQRVEALQLLTRKVFTALVPAMKNGAKLQFQDGAGLSGAGSREAILAGLVEKDGVFEKVEEEEVVVPLRLKKKTPAQKTAVEPAVQAAHAPLTFNGVVNAQGKRPAVVLDLGEYSDGDELVDEDSLLTFEERNRPPQQRELLPVPIQSPRAPHTNRQQPQSARLTDRSDASPARTAHAAWPSGWRTRIASGECVQTPT